MLRNYIGSRQKYHVRGWVKGTAAALAAVLAAVTIGVVPNAPKTVAAYGKAADSSKTSELAVTIPEGIKSDNYTSKVFAETVASEPDKNLTDCDGDMASLSVTKEAISQVDVTDGQKERERPWEKEISSVDITGIAAPRAGIELDKSVACSTEGIVTATLSWQKDGVEVSGVADFQSVYKAVIKLTATQESIFNNFLTITVNGIQLMVDNNFVEVSGGPHIWSVHVDNQHGTMTVYCAFPKTAATLQPEVRNINLGTLGLNDPDIPADEDVEWSGSYVYFGTYEGTPVKYRVLDADTQDYNADGDTDRHTMLLDSDKLLFKSVYLDSSVDKESLKDELGDIDPNKIWLASKIRTELNSIKAGAYDYAGKGFLTAAFTDIEQNAVAESYKETQTGRDYYYADDRLYPKLTGEKIFILDISELSYGAYGYYKGGQALWSKSREKEAVVATGDDFYDWTWYTRTASTYTAADIIVFSARAVQKEGQMNSGIVLSSNLGISPALNIDLSKISYIAAANENKADAFAVTNVLADNGEWKLTLKDSEGFLAEIKDDKRDAKTGAAGGDALTVTITVTNVPKMSSGAEYGQISAMLVDATGTVAAYGKVADEAKVGALSITLPDGVKVGNYTLKVFAETVNSAADKNLTDYASDMVSIPMRVTEEGISYFYDAEVTETNSTYTDRITLKWQEVDGATGYNVYVNNQKINTSLITDNTYTIKGLNKETSYDICVTTVTAVGESEKSSVTKIKTGDIMLADINNDQKVNIIDAMQIFHYVSGRNKKVNVTTVNSDINGDGKITIVDAMKIFHYASGRSQEY